MTGVTFTFEEIILAASRQLISEGKIRSGFVSYTIPSKMGVRDLDDFCFYGDAPHKDPLRERLIALGWTPPANG